MDYQVLRCAVCGSEELSPETDYASFEHHARFAGLGGTGVFGGIKDLTADATRARICLDCGHLILFVSDHVRERLRTALGE